MGLDDLLGRFHCDLEEWYEKLSSENCQGISDDILNIINKIEDFDD